jgi:hypothetical protein
MPPFGEIAIFDRSWYGRVLVERVEGFCTEKEWRRAYGEINAMEKTLIDSGAVLMKFYLHISKEEQLKRFEQRAADPYKHWKISEEDWRNRRKWKEHVESAEEMFHETSTALDPHRVRVQMVRPHQGPQGHRQEIHPGIRRIRQPRAVAAAVYDRRRRAAERAQSKRPEGSRRPKIRWSGPLPCPIPPWRDRKRRLTRSALASRGFAAPHDKRRKPLHKTPSS